MKRTLANNIIPIFILVGAIFISICILYAYDLDMLQKISSIVGSLSLVLALATYSYNRNQDRVTSAIEQMSFLRGEIIPEWERIIGELKMKNNKYLFSKIEIKEPTLDFMRREYSRNFQDQANIFLNDLSILTSSLEIVDSKILGAQVRLLNMLEEFSIKAYHFGTYNHQALNPVHNVFIEIVEKNAVALFFTRDVVVGSPIYSEVLSLYKDWKQNANKSSIIKRLERQGFITKKQREAFFEEARLLEKSTL